MKTGQGNQGAAGAAPRQGRRRRRPQLLSRRLQPFSRRLRPFRGLHADAGGTAVGLANWYPAQELGSVHRQANTARHQVGSGAGAAVVAVQR